MSLIVVYNTCGISGRDNTSDYIKSLTNLVNQSIQCPIVVSACRPLDNTIPKLQEEFKDKIYINVIHDILPVNVTFNHTVHKIVARFGKFKAYSYTDSGVIYNETTSLEKMFHHMETEQYGIVSCPVSEDSGFERWGIPQDGSNYIIPVGKAINGHTDMFSNKMLEYYGRLMPDIFKTFCTESTYSFLIAALKLKWLICKETSAFHHHSMDLASSGFLEERKTLPTNWDHNFATERSMAEIISDPYGKMWGFGYEEVQSILMHDPGCFDENGFCKNDKLKWWLKHNIFLRDYEFHYDTINSEWVN